MLAILNRWRGTWGIWAKWNGIILGILFYLFTSDIYTSLGITVMYVLGESFGWGKWIGGVERGKIPPATGHELDEEGRNNGIHYLAELFYKENDNYYKYCYTALTLRGFYWVALTLLPLAVGGYIDIITYLGISGLLGWGFPLSVRLGGYTTQKFNYKHKYFGMNGFWEQAEVWYGVMMDIALIYLLITI